MGNEKQTDIKEKLEAMECLPGEAFEKDAAWEKLHRRLQVKPRSKRVIWYWAAAACLLPLLVLLWITINKKEPALAKVTKQQHTTTPVIQLPLVQKEIMSSPLMVSTIKNKPLKNIAPEVHKIPANKNNNIKTDKPPAANTTVETIPDIATNIAPPTATDTNISMATIAALPIAKKKLRVVHINELDASPEPSLTIKSNHRQSDFKFLFGNVNAAGTSAVIRQDYSGGLKIPLTN